MTELTRPGAAVGSRVSRGRPHVPGGGLAAPVAASALTPARRVSPSLATCSSWCCSAALFPDGVCERDVTVRELNRPFRFSITACRAVRLTARKPIRDLAHRELRPDRLSDGDRLATVMVAGRAPVVRNRHPKRVDARLQAREPKDGGGREVARDRIGGEHDDRLGVLVAVWKACCALARVPDALVNEEGGPFEAELVRRASAGSPPSGGPRSGSSFSRCR